MEIRLDRMPPYSDEAEQSVLGAMLLDRDAVVKVLPLLRPEDFYRTAHQTIYEAIVVIYEKGEPIDLVTLVSHLKSTNRLENIGGASYIADLAESVPTSANASYYADIVRDKSVIRQLIRSATEIVESGYAQESEVEGILEDAERKIFAITQRGMRGDFVPIRTVVGDALEKISKLSMAKGGYTGIPTGFTRLDHMTLGLQPSDLIIIAARPSMGKTAFCLNIAQNIALHQDKAVAFFSLEMPREQIAMRMLSGEAMISSQKIRMGDLDDEEWDRLSSQAGILSKTRMFIDDTPGITATEMRAKCRHLQAENGLDLVVIDYMQLMESSSKSGNRVQELSEISRSLKSLAREMNVPVIALSQLSRAVESRTNHRPQLSDLRESGAIEQDADIVGFLYRDDYYNPDTSETPNTAEVIIAKHRNGPIGAFRLTFQKDYTRFDNYAEDDTVEIEE